MEEQNTVSQDAGMAAESEVPQVVGAMEALIGPEEKLENFGGGGDDTNGADGEDESFRVKRKRGRPRKHPAMVEARRQEFMALPEYSVTQQKRGRGRPRGSGKWQTMAASLGGSVGDTAGSDFTPYIIAIREGENIVQRILSLSQRIPESLCILSASGTISTAEFYIPASRGRVVRYEGKFSIIYLNGSHTYDEKSGGKVCLLSVQLTNYEGRFFGGAVAGSLIAGGPTQLILATFRQKLIRQPPIIRPIRLETPKLNKGPITVTVPVQAQISKPPDAEAKCVSTNFSGPSDPLLNEVTIEGSNMGHASPPPHQHVVDWKLLQPPAACGPEHVASSDFGNRVI